MSQRTASVLDLFFAPDRPIVDLRRVKSTLLDPNAAPGDCSQGLVRKPEGFRRTTRGALAEFGGIFCEKIFGPLRPLACRCGRLRGAAQAGHTCPKCGVLCGDPSLRDHRFGHLEVCGVVHPALYPAIAEALGARPEEIAAVARGDAEFIDGRVVRDEERTEDETEASTEERDDEEAAEQNEEQAEEQNNIQAEEPATFGAEALLQALEQAGASQELLDVAVLRQIPLPPPGDRPLLRADAPSACCDWIGPLNEAWQALLVLANRQKRLIELEAPPIILQNEQREVQLAFEKVLEVTLRPPRTDRRWESETVTCPRPLLAPPPTEIPEDAPSTPIGMIWIDDERILVQTARALWLLSHQGELQDTFPPARLIVGSAHGSRLIFSRGTDFCYGDSLPPEKEWWEKNLEDPKVFPGFLLHSVLDLSSRSWLTTYPEDAPRYYVANDQPEELFVYDARADVSYYLPWGGDRPECLALTRDGRFAWVGEGEGSVVIDLETGVPHAEPPIVEAAPPVLLLEVGTAERTGVDPDDEGAHDERAEDEGAEDEGADDESFDDECGGAAAVALTPEQSWRFLDREGHLGDPNRVFLKLGFPVTAAAFSPKAERLAVTSGGELLIIEVTASPRVQHRSPLPGSARELALDGRSR